MTWNAIILAAGNGERMISSVPKVLHKIAGVSMLEHVARKACVADCVFGVISECMRDNFINLLPSGISYVVQNKRLGTGHAVSTVLHDARVASNVSANSFKNNQFTIILYGDVPLLPSTLIDSLMAMMNKDCNLAIISFAIDDIAKQYGRIIGEVDLKVGSIGNIEDIIEYKDSLMTGENKISLCNSGIMAIDTNMLLDLESKIGNNNAANEFYITDIVALARKLGAQCRQIVAHETDVCGVNSRSDLAIAENIMQERLRKMHMNNGVTMINPGSNFFDVDVKIGNDSVIESGVCISGNTTLGCGTTVGSYTRINNSIIGNDVKIGSNCLIDAVTLNDASIVESHVVLSHGSVIGSCALIRSFSYIEGLKAKDSVTIGPFARIREHTKLDNGVKIGNFVEIKNSNIGVASSVCHLSYIGDSQLGSWTNIGAGTVTCNYDGFAKYTTNIGDRVFVGSNTCFIAPVTVHDDTIIGAGSVITKNVMTGSMAITRIEQKNIPGAALKYKAKRRKENNQK